MKLKARLLNRCTKLLDILQALLQDLRRDTTQLALDPHVAEDLKRLLEKRLDKIQQAVEVLKLRIEPRDETAIDKTLTDALVDIQKRCYRLQENIRNDSCKKLPPIKHFECLTDAVRKTILEQLQTMVRYASLRYFLPGEPEPDAKVLQLAQQLKAEQQLAHQSLLFLNTLKEVRELGKQRDARISCFISYAWASEDRPWENWVQPFIKTLCEHLRLAGVEVYLDVDNSLEGFNSHHHMDRIADCSYVILMGTESLLDKFNLGVSSVCYELNLIRQRRRNDAVNGLYKVIPLIVSGTMDTALPADYERFTVIKTCGGQYVATLKDLIRQLYDYGTQHQDYLNSWQTLATQHRDWFTQSDTHGFADLIIDSVTPEPVVPLPINHNTVNALPTDWQFALKARYSAQHFIPSLFAQESVVTQGLSIENYYVNLALITEQEQQQKEKVQKTQEFGANPNLLESAQNETNILSSKNFIPSVSPSHEQLFAVQTPIELTELFKVCDKANDKRANASHHLLLLGGAGIGKSTLCQYIAYQWAQGQLWSGRYDGVVWLRLRDFNDTYFPVNREYSLEEIIARLVFGYKDTDLIPGFDQFMQQVKANKARFLFLLDGYDELPTLNQKNHWHSNLQELFSFPEVIVTSRPQPIQHYQPDLAVQVVGFTDANIDTYIQQFFSAQPQKLERLHHFLKEQSVVKSLLHIPINAELFCQLWRSEELKEAELSFTELYQHITQWLFKRNLTKQGINITQIPNAELESYCGQLPLYLEQLAWQAMQAEKIYLPEALISQAIKQVDEKKESQAKIPTESLTTQLQTKLTEILGLAQQLNHPELFSHLVQSLNCLNTNSAQPKLNSYDELRLHSGFLRSTSAHVRECYFMHLSFQEFFAARYAANVIQNAGSQGNADYEAFQTYFKANKFNPKLQVVWWFIAGLLKDDGKALDRYFHLLLQEPRDISVVNELPLFTYCLEQSNLGDKSRIGQQILYEVNERILVLIKLSDFDLGKLKQNINTTLTLCRKFLQSKIVSSLLALTNEIDQFGKKIFIDALLLIGKKAVTEKVVERLLALLDGQDMSVSLAAAEVLGLLAEKTVTDTIIEKLLILLGSADKRIRRNAVRKLGQLGEKAATEKVIESFLGLLSDEDKWVRGYAARALGQLGKKAATKQVIERLLCLQSDQDKWVGGHATEVLRGLEIKTAMNKVIKTRSGFQSKAAVEQKLEELMDILDEKNMCAMKVAINEIKELQENAATEKVIEKLLSLLDSRNDMVKCAAAEMLGLLGIKAATDQVIEKLLGLLDSGNDEVKCAVAQMLGRLGIKAATVQMIEKLLDLLDSTNDAVKYAAAEMLGVLGIKAATDQAIEKLLGLIRVKSNGVRMHKIAAYALISLSQEATTEKAMVAHLSLLSDEDDDIRAAAAYALVRKGEKAATEKVIAKLLDTLNDRAWRVRVAAVEVLVRLGEKSATEQVLVGLLSLLSDKVDYIRSAVVKALVRLGEKSAQDKFIKKLIEWLMVDAFNRDLHARKVFKNLCKKASPEKRFALLSLVTDENIKYLYPYLVQLFIGIPLTVKNNQLHWHEPTQGQVSLKLSKITLQTFIPNFHELLKVDNKLGLKITPFLWSKSLTLEDKLLQALSNGNLSVLQVAIQHDPSWLNYLTDERENVAFRVFQLNTNQAFEMQKLILRHRPFVSLEHLNQVLENDFLLHYEDKRETQAQDAQLIKTVIKQLMGKPNNISKIQQNRTQVLAYTLGLELDKDRYDRGLLAKDYLLFRLAFYLQLLGKVSNDTLHINHYPQGLDIRSSLKYLLIAFIKRELLLVWEALRLEEEANHIFFSDEGNRPALWEAHALSIIDKLKALSPGEALIYPTGYQGHCIYVVFTRQANSIIGRVDNLLAVDIQRRHLCEEKGYKPFFLGEWQVDETLGQSNCSLKHYLVNRLCIAKSQSRTRALSLIYLTTPQDPTRLSNFPVLPAQGEDDCVVKGFKLGLLCRSESEDVFKFLEEEHAKLWVSALINPTPVNNNSSPSPSISSSNNHNQRAMGLTVENTQNESVLSHDGLMDLLAEALNISKSEVLIGSTVEQTIVDITGINVRQNDPKFRRNHQDQSTMFYLNFPNEQTKQQFINFYQSKCPGIILRSVEESDKIRIDFETSLFVKEIIPVLKLRRVAQTNSALPTVYPSPLSQLTHTNTVSTNNNHQRPTDLSQIEEIDKTKDITPYFIKAIEDLGKTQIDFARPLVVEKIIPMVKIFRVQQPNAVSPTTYPLSLSQPDNINSVINNNTNTLLEDTSDSDSEPDNQSRCLLM